ncbi:MAG: M20/M25/M40 family metallo-hydrolase [Saprospiraceae bacterium]|nr:M20/M25/M40 family metallo-hydrolase [Saprospiraceae bacterium]
MTKMRLFLVIFIFGTLQTLYSQDKLIHHSVSATLDPSSSFIDVEDNIRLNKEGDETIVFELNSSLNIYSTSKNIKIILLKSQAKSPDVGMDRDDIDKPSNVKLNKWQIRLNSGERNFSIKYHGKIESPIEQSMENYQRGFSESPGIISDTGVYLAGSTFWIPTISDAYFSFDMKVNLPDGWSSVSQGQRTIHEESKGKHIDKWSSPEPQEEIFLIAAKFHEYSAFMNNGVASMAFLRTKDDALAGKYLEVTEQYMSMYEEMIGKFPYSKFALIENFWETGYGMPSFTLLGEKIIRFPFILHSSYPHELLHNWWGNSVYIDFETGNWCEGLTAYLADHLIKEQREQAAEYRRSTLQKYADFVNDHNDFPLSKFSSRHDASSEAIGYGKSLMFFHMLRNSIGDENFLKGLRDFYSNHKYAKAGFADIRNSMQKFTDKDLVEFFNLWIEKPGAPELLLSNAEMNQNGQLSIEIQQIQKAAIYDLEIPVYITTSQGTQKETVNLNQGTKSFSFNLKGNPVKLEIDPYYDLFRTVDPDEVPPALSKILASRQNLIILPSDVSTSQKELYIEFAEKWIKSDNDSYKIVFDNEIAGIPETETGWIFGRTNKFYHLIENQLNTYNDFLPSELKNLISDKQSSIAKELIVTVFEPENHNKQLAFIELSNKTAVDGLIRKLPHYGKYSYLGFEGDEPVNVLKGQWEVIKSPLSRTIDNSLQVQSVPEKRKALGELKPVFSKTRMKDHVEHLASPEMNGRGLGTPELDKAAEYIADLFRQYGLKPLNSSYFQEFTHTFPEKGQMKLKNVVGIIEGIDPKLSEQLVVLSAHYDHLGMGWPDVRPGNEGKIHFGADDNASGVSIMLELAKTFGNTLKPARTIIFVAFTGEEAGLVGSRYFVKNFSSLINGSPFANVNLDTDGRLFDKKLLVLNANSAREWKFIFMGTDYTTGVRSEIVEKDMDASDQKAFIENGIPAVQIFAGPNEDYHKPTDTPDKIDYEGMVKIAAVVKEVIEYLSDRKEPMNFTGTQDNSVKSNDPNLKRSASTGAMPDFSYNGQGMKVGSVSAGSAGEKGGLLKDDVIVRINETDIIDLKQYSAELKKFSPGDEVILTIKRGVEIMKINVKLGAR